METWVAAVIIAVQYIVIVIIGVFLFRRLRDVTIDDLIRDWRRWGRKPDNGDAKGG